MERDIRKVLFLTIWLGSSFCSASIRGGQLIEEWDRDPPDWEFLNQRGPKIIFHRKEYLVEDQGSPQTIQSLWIASRDGSHQRFLTYCRSGSSLLALAGPDLSPDGTKLIYTGLDDKVAAALGLPPQNGLWLLDLKDGRRTRLYAEPVSQVLWSRDGQELFFEKGVKGLYRVEVDRGRTQRIMELGRMEEIKENSGGAHLWGPTIRLHDIHVGALLYTRKRYRMEVRGSNQHQRGTVTTGLAQPQEDHIWMMDLVSGTSARLGPGEGPKFSPDGKYIIFNRQGQLWIRRIDSGMEQSLGPGRYPAFSPDGKEVAFVNAGAYGNEYGWIDLLVADLESARARVVPLEEGWRDTMERLVPNFNRSFQRIGYFNQRPRLLWLASKEGLIYSPGYNTFFMADLKNHRAGPLFCWLQVSPVPEFLVGDSLIVLTSPQVETPRRRRHPLRKSGWLEEEDIWEVSLDGRRKRMLVENGGWVLKVE